MKEDSAIKFLIECIRKDNCKDFEEIISNYIKNHSINWKGMENPYLQRAFLLFYNKTINFPEIPKKIKKELMLQYMNNHARNTKIKELTINLSKKFNNKKIDAIFLKGASLLFTIYKKDIAERHMQDIDVLVRKEDVKKAQEILIKNRFKRYLKFPVEKELHYTSTKGNILLELHCNIGSDVTDEQINDIFKSYKIINYGNTRIKILDAEHTIITACLNFIRDSCYRSEYFFPNKKELRDNLYFSPFFFLAEMKKILEYYKSEIDWKRFFKIINSYKEEYKIIASLCIMKRVFNLEIPFENVKIKNIYAGTFIRLSKIISKDKPIKHLLLMRDIDMFYEGMKLIKEPLVLIRKMSRVFKRVTRTWKT
jgi:hypothetical protein